MGRIFRSAGFFFLSLLLTGAGADVKPGDILLQDAVSYRAEGRQLQDAGEMERASTAYRRAVTLNPGYAEAYNDLGVVLESMGDPEGAMEAYKSAVMLKPGFGAAHTNLAILYEDAGRTKEAAEHWVARVRLGPPDDPWVIKAREKVGRYQIPIPETPQEASESRKQAVRMALLAGQGHMDAHRWDDAIREFEKALALDPGNIKAERLLNASRLKAGEAQRKLVREMEASKSRVLRDMKLAEKERAAQDREARKLQALQEESVKRQEEAARRKEEAAAKKEAALARKETPARRVEPVKPVKARAMESKKPWWKFWASNVEGREWAQKHRRDQELEKEIERVRRVQAAQDDALRKAERMLLSRAPAPAAVLSREQAAVAPPSKPSAPAVPKPTPVSVVPKPASAEALKLSQEYARERTQTTGRARDELYQRGSAAMRAGDYRQAAENFRQVLLLDPNDSNARQALARAERAWEKEQEEQGLGEY